MTAATAETLTARVWRALATVVDPEFHEPITNLGFVAGVEVRLREDRGHAVSVRLRLPTCFCAPNSAYETVADAHDAVFALPCVDTVDIVLEDHPVAGFESETGEVGVSPVAARGKFPRTAHLGCLERAVRRLVDEGWQVDAPPAGRLGVLPRTPDHESLLRFARVDIDHKGRSRRTRPGDEVREEVPS
ncbi:iron-sulfur cluster assembly protein [Amycolatopsis rhabdoformis]|uniref:Iron-sulfur cluster assembly protein n=1 Tax=Amycolatopsis rhabdoformis TaxID=1448059 RepID=A0ABZ1IG08_9PSEU|nr:iron-sulfur cluster assembly protein [Amycolatopsis rhabdoformis]WSE33380.1 iron-sulfur cluster assembly protein [Amycolatopsis rhabdoformis]